MALGSQGAPPPQGPGGRGGGRGEMPPASTGTGVIVGTVVDAGTGRPVTGAIVTLGGRGPLQPAPVIVGADGRFVFRDLPPGSFSLPVMKNGYLDGAAGRTSPAGSGRPVELRDGERLGDVVVRIWRHAVLAGTVVDERGEPAVAANVVLFQRAIVNGEWGLQERNSTRSDDRGAYRFSKVAPGRYLIAVQQDMDSFMESAMLAMAADLPAIMNVVAGALAGGMQLPDVDFRARMIPLVFAPGVATADEAATIVVGSGDERSGLNIRAARVPTYRIAGTIGGPEPLPQNLTVQLVAPSQVSNRQVGVNVGGRGGRFDFAAVPPGQYELRAVSVPRAQGQGRGGKPQPPAPDTPTWWAIHRITISDQDELGLTLLLRQGIRVSGRLQFEGTTPAPPTEQFSIFAASGDGGLGARANAPASVGPDGSFKTVGLPPGRYALRLAGTIAPWRLKAVRAGGRDVTDLPLDVEVDDIDEVVIALTDQPLATISGAVRPSGGDTNAVVYVFPANRQLWAYLGPTALRFKTARATENGRYAVTGLPDGDYYVFAGREERLADWLQPDVLEQFAAVAARVQLREGEQRTLDVTRSDR
jgi:hypothetical protein